jgi:hypothetical protein
MRCMRKVNKFSFDFFDEIEKLNKKLIRGYKTRSLIFLVKKLNFGKLYNHDIFSDL